MVLRRMCAIGALALVAGSALAVDLNDITLFGQSYRVQRFSYAVDYVDPTDPNFTITLTEVEGAQWIGDDAFLLSTDNADFFGSAKNQVVQLRFTRDGMGEVDGVEFLAVRVVNDPALGFGTVDISPSGISLNTGSAGLAANGGILVADSENQFIRGFDFVTGAPVGEFNASPNTEIDDVEFIASLGQVWSVREDVPAFVDRHDVGGMYLGSFPIAANVDPSIGGSPKGLVYLPASGAYPMLLSGGAALVTLDDDGPGIQAFDLGGGLIGFEPLTDDGTAAGNPLLQTPDGGQLIIEAAMTIPETGQIILVNQGDVLLDQVLFVLTPIPCEGDTNGDNAVNFTDLNSVLSAFGMTGDGLEGDVNGDGVVNFEDLNVVLSNFGADCTR